MFLKRSANPRLIAEYEINHIVTDPLYPIRRTGKPFQVSIYGRADFLETTPERDRVWEIKFTRDLTAEHMLQLALYGFLHWRSDTENEKAPPEMLLYNVKTDQLLKCSLRVKEGYEKMDYAVRKFIYLKEVNKAALRSDEEFLADLKRLRTQRDQ